MFGDCDARGQSENAFERDRGSGRCRRPGVLLSTQDYLSTFPNGYYLLIRRRKSLEHYVFIESRVNTNQEELAQLGHLSVDERAFIDREL